MAAKKNRSARRLPRLLRVAKCIDEEARFLDFRLNHTNGRRLFPRHTWIIAVTACIVLLAMTNGPLILEWRGPLAWIVAAVALAALVVVIHFAAKGLQKPLWTDGLEPRWRWLPLTLWGAWLAWLLLGRQLNEWPYYVLTGCVLLGSASLSAAASALATSRGVHSLTCWGVFATAAIIIWCLADSNTTEFMRGAPYRQILAPVGIMVLLFAMPISRWWAWFVFRRRRQDFRDAFQTRLDQTELFDPRFPSNAESHEIVRSFLLALVGSPIQLLLIPGFVVVMAPYDRLISWGLYGLLGSWLFMAMTVFHPRLNAVRDIYNRQFFEGASLCVSLFIIGIAAARLAGVGYVTTVLDGSTRLTIVQYLIVFYAMSWMYDYWSMRSLIEVLLGILHPDREAPVRVCYYGQSRNHPNRPQWLQPHGGSRIAVVRETGDDALPWHFNIFRPLDLFREIANRSSTDSKARRRIRLLEAHVQFFRAVPAILLLASLSWCAVQLLEQPRIAHIEASAIPTPAPNAFSLKNARASIRNHPDETHPNPPVYFVAASGGGTRAAIHTMTVLKALEERQVLHRVAGVSSVSGGSLANAYFANRRPDLMNADEDIRRKAWSEFRDVVTDRHIEYVVNGACEWRHIEGDRFGTILSESFDRHFREDRRHMGPCRDLAVIFSTTLAGEASDRQASSARTYGENSGSRLVITNIPSFTTDRVVDADPNYASDLRCVCFGDPEISLAAAASASANFPPVFSNVAVDDLPDGPRYWVTDGGAMDNRGLITLLLAIRTILEDWTPQEDGELPPIRIVVADASAFSPGFRQDRGLGAVGGAGWHVSSKLIATLLKQVQTMHADKSGAPGNLTIHDLTLPKAIRSGMGTHWMMPTATTLAPSKWIPGTDDSDEATLTGDELLCLFDQLFATTPAWPGDFRGEWISEDDPKRGLKSLLDADPPPQP